MMVGAVLVQNTSWIQADKAVKQLEQHGVLDFNSLLVMDDQRLGELIRSAGYFRVKTRRLKALAECLHPYDSPEFFFIKRDALLRQDLLGVKGIGKETADSILCYGAGKPVFVVDAYTKRLFLRLGWVGEKAGYDEMQTLVQEAMPREARQLGEYHALIVQHAKQHCRPRSLCAGCPVVFCPVRRDKAHSFSG